VVQAFLTKCAAYGASEYGLVCDLWNLENFLALMHGSLSSEQESYEESLAYLYGAYFTEDLCAR
jgi:hypothetical protein